MIETVPVPVTPPSRSTPPLFEEERVTVLPVPTVMVPKCAIPEKFASKVADGARVSSPRTFKFPATPDPEKEFVPERVVGLDVAPNPI